MNLTKTLISALCILTLSGCANWIYRIDIPQGNFLDEKDVKLLRIGMTKEQTAYVLGNPVVKDSFDEDTWYYIYQIKRGMQSRGKNLRKELIIDFDQGRIAKVSGDFELGEDFNTPLDQ